MLNYSFSTVIMTIFTSNLLIFVISLCFRNRRIMETVGYQLLAVFSILTFIRFALPFEFPCSINVIFPPLLSQIVSFIRWPFYEIGLFKFSIWFFIEIIWAIGIIAGLFIYMRQHYVLYQYIKKYGTDITNQQPYMHLFSEICSVRSIRSRFHIIKLPGISSPMLYGFRTHYILLPYSLNLSDNDIYYILCHELLHYKHRDLWLKCVIRLITILYWWNPFSYIFREQTDTIIEMRIDASIVKSDKRRAVEYLNCLLHMAESIETNQYIPSKLAISFISNNKYGLEKRFTMICKNQKRRIGSLNVLFTASVIAIYLLSYLFIFEASYIAPDVDGFSLSSANSYIIINSDGNYDIYLNEILIETVESLESYSPEIPIYTKEEKENLINEE